MTLDDGQRNADLYVLEILGAAAKERVGELVVAVGSFKRLPG